MKYIDAAKKSPQEVTTELGSDIQRGLTNDKVKSLLNEFGHNELQLKEVTWYEILLRQFKSAFVYLLIAAAVVSFILHENLDGFMVLLFIMINALLGFFQEFKSEQNVKLLKSYVKPKAKVIRNGQEAVVFSSDLVQGDLVILETGDIIPADLRIIKENSLLIDETILTGESTQIRKSTDQHKSEVSQIYQAVNIGFMGTTVVEGSGIGIVISTAKNTEMGKIAKLTTETYRQSGFEKQINKFSKFILYLIIFTLILVFVAHLFIKTNVSIPKLAIFAIALAVGVVPEAMPLVTTFSLSHGATILAKKKVVVKRLSAIEDLGSIEVLCSDKTGTLTENKLSVADIYSVGSADKDEVVFYSALAASAMVEGKKLANNSFDLAVFNNINSSQKEIISGIKRENELPFDPVRRRNSVIVNIHGNKSLIVRGAAESILPNTTNVSDALRKELESWIVDQGKKGHRVIAVSKRDNFDRDDYKQQDEELEQELLGLIAFSDTVKSTTRDAVSKAESLKVVIKILTGDSKEVAGAVAYEVGINSSPDNVLTGEEFDNLTAEEQLSAVDEYHVFARVSPEQKYQIIKILQEKYRVGFLGEGINDAPGLKISDVAIVVDGASDIAREAADIVLLKQDLNVIVDGIEEGRKTFVNTVKYIKSTLASNFGNFYAMAFVSLIIDYLPMLPIQILLVNLLSDFPMISIASDEVEPGDLKNPKSYEIKEIVLIATILGLVSTFFDFVFFGIFSRMGEGPLQTYWFIGSILTELVLIYSIRTKLPFYKTTRAPSKTVIILTVAAALLTLIIPLTQVGRSLFTFITPTLPMYALIVLIVLLYFVTTEIIKLMFYRVAEQKR